jgi:threonine synthase
MLAAQALGSSPIADAFADDRGISRVRSETHVASLAVGDPSHGELALGAARATGGAVVAIPEDEIHAYTELLSELTGVTPDPAGGAALGAVMSAVRRGELEPGARVVIVVTGARPDAPLAEGAAVTTVDPDPYDVLDALGLRS